MSLSSDMIQEFAKVTNDDKQTPTESTFYGTIVKYDNELYVRIDGSDQLTPITATADIKPNDRVVVMIKNHSATVTGNITSPSASSDSVKELDGKVDEMGTQISEFDIVVADKIGTKEFSAQVGRIDTLVSDNVTIREELNANKADIDELVAENVTITESLEAAHADIEKLDASKITADFVETHYAKIEDLEATNLKVVTLTGTYGDFVVLTTTKFEALDASIKKLDTEKLTAEQANIKYANIDFSNIQMAAVKELFTKSGIIKDLVVGDQSITGELVGVTIKGDLIEGSTIIADKLVIKGEDGIYYKLNTLGGVTPDGEITEEKLQNGLHGDVLIKKSITAEKINVHDLVAFGATIGGFKITDDSIYSGAKASVDNTTRGIYLDNDGQVAFGDSNNYLKYYKDANDKWKLEMRANSIRMGSSDKTVEEIIDKIDNLNIGGRNLLRKSSVSEYYDEWVLWRGCTVELVSGGWLRITKAADQNTYGASPPAISEFPVAGEYIISFDAMSDSTTTLNYNYIMKSGGNIHISNVDISNVATRITIPFTLDEPISNCSVMIGSADGSSFYIKNIKVEYGNHATDWTEAPEDVDARIEDVKENANQAALDAATVGAQQIVDGGTIATISNQLANLIVGKNGESVLKEVMDDGTVRYNFGNILDDNAAFAEKIKELVETTDDAEALANEMKASLEKHSETLSYIDKGDIGGVPFLELGILKDENGANIKSKFKVRITNQEIQFLENDHPVAWINNEELHIKKSEIVSEQRIGSFVWVSRTNGNMGLMWKGGIS